MSKSDVAPIAISIGDPTGIGPEIALKALHRFASPCTVFGNHDAIARAASQLDLPVPAIVAIADPHRGDYPAGQPNAASGHAAWLAVTEAVKQVQGGAARALVTAPLSKAAMHLAGHQWPGHTELLADLAGNCAVRMMLANTELRVVLVTVHQALRDALNALSADQIEQTIRIAHQGLRQFGISKPRLAVAGVNPHAGENGLFGDEETRLITPAIRAAKEAGIDVVGPLAPDTVFMQARGFASFDAVIAMYHDQGLIPIKYLGVEHGVNVTLGLPFVRTSPDHGTAFDIAGQGRADASSMLAALELADQLSRHE